MKYVFTFILIAFSYVSHAQYTNLVLEGGGMKGIAYAGALEVLDSLGISDSIERIAGTSSGAMNGLMYALGYSGKEIRHLNLNTNFGKYNQVGFPLIGGLIRVKKTYGYYKTDKLIEDLGKVMAAKGFSPDLTFEELYIAHQSGKNVKLLYLTGANLTDQKTEVFSHETYPTMQVLDAIRISISIPMYFEAVFMQPDGSLVEKNDADSTTKIMVDGGVLDNYPFFVFDTLVTVNSGDNSYYKCNIHSLGIKLETDMISGCVQGIDDAERDFGIIGRIIVTCVRHLGPQQGVNVFINTHNFNPKLKRQKKATKLRVMQYGRKAVFEYFISR